MDRMVPHKSVEFRTRLVEVINDNFLFRNDKVSDNGLSAEKYKSLIDTINGFVLICDYTTGMYEFVSDGIRTSLGYDVQGYSKEELTSFVFSVIHKDHGQFLLNTILPNVFKYFKENSNVDIGTRYRYTCCFKVSNIYKAYLWYLIDTVVIESDENGFPLKTLITCTDIHQFKKDEYVCYNILKKNNDGVYEVVFEGVGDGPTNQYNLTSREIQIINLISQGYTNNQVAHKLFISPNTVKTHRKSIVKKTGCYGTAQLTNFAYSMGLQ